MEKKDDTICLDWVRSNFPVSNPLAVTLDSRPWVDGRSLDRISLERDITHFLNRLNYRLFRKKYSRYGKKLGVLALIEGDKRTHLHIHLNLECPPHLSVEFMDKLIRECWGKTIFGYSPRYTKGVVVVKVYDLDGWIGYITKKKTKEVNLPSSMDWISLQSSTPE